MDNTSQVREVEGIIVSIKSPFRLFKKANPVVSIRTKRGGIIQMEATPEMIKKLPISIGVGRYAEAQYKNHPSGKGYELINLF